MKGRLAEQKLAKALEKYVSQLDDLSSEEIEDIIASVSEEHKGDIGMETFRKIQRDLKSAVSRGANALKSYFTNLVLAGHGLKTIKAWEKGSDQDDSRLSEGTWWICEQKSPEDLAGRRIVAGPIFDEEGTQRVLDQLKDKSEELTYWPIPWQEMDIQDKEQAQVLLDRQDGEEERTVRQMGIIFERIIHLGGQLFEGEFDSDTLFAICCEKRGEDSVLEKMVNKWEALVGELTRVHSPLFEFGFEEPELKAGTKAGQARERLAIRALGINPSLRGQLDMTPDEAREYLKSLGYTDREIKALER